MTRANARRITKTLDTASSEFLTSRLRIFGVLLICAKVSLVPIVFDHSADLPFPVAKALLSHALAYPLAAVLLALSLRFGRLLLIQSVLHIPALAFLAASAIASIWAPDRLVAMYGTHTRMLGLGTMADFVLLYFGIVFLARTRADAIAVVASGVASSVIVMGYGVLQLTGNDPFGWNIDPRSRPFSTLGQSTTLAEYLTVLLIGVAAIALFDGKLGWPLRAILFGYALAALGLVLLTQTRSALLGAITGTLVLILLTWFRHPSRRARAMSAIGAAASVCVLGLALLFTPLGARVLGTFDVSPIDVTGDASAPRLEESTDIRLALYATALEMARDRPLFGYGPDNFAAVFPTYRAESLPPAIRQSLPTSAHGWPAQIAATSGLIGLAAFIGVGVVAALLLFSVSFSALAWAGGAMLAAFLGAGLTTISDVGTDWLFWASAGAVAATTARPPELALVASVQTKRRTPRSRISQSNVVSLVTVGALIVATGMSAATANAYTASREVRDARSQQFAGRQRAVESASRATVADTGRAEYWDALGLAYIGTGRTADAVPAFERAVRLQPYNAGYLGDLASALILLIQHGDRQKAVQAQEVAERAVRTDPNNPQVHLTRALVMQVVGNLLEARRSVERALELDPQSTNTQLYTTATQILLDSGNPVDAIELARRGFALIGNPPSTFQLHIDLARALATVGRRTEALTELDLALSIRPNDPSALQLRAQIQQLPSQ